MTDLLSLRKKLNLLCAEFDHAKKKVSEENIKLEDAREHVQYVEQAQRIIQAVAEKVQQSVHSRIGSVVSRCLQSVFAEDAYEFQIIFEQKRGRTEARLSFVLNGNEMDPTSEGCGGQVDVAAFALRLVCLMLSQPPRRKVLILDEPFRNINGEEYQDRMSEMLLTIARETKTQIIMVSDDSWLKVGNVIELGE